MNPRTLGTHDGPFHADEVTACALLVVFDLVDETGLVRTRDKEALDACEFVCDVGGVYDPSLKRFDHHQHEYTGPMSSAGMVLQYLRDEGVVEDELYGILRDNLVTGVDDHDNGIAERKGVCTFSIVIANLTPIAYDASDADHEAAFFEAFSFAKGHITRMRERYAYYKGYREKVGAAMEGASDALIFDEKIPWQDNFFALGGVDHPAKFVIMPAGDHWKLRGIPPDPDNRMGVRVPLPKEWAGLLDDELKEASGIEGAIFCHKGRFISVWETKEDALAALKKVLG